ncbi:MAG: hypothetical protein JSV96_01670, partial [Candidatus Aminicenantes bacterium]
PIRVSLYGNYLNAEIRTSNLFILMFFRLFSNLTQLMAAVSTSVLVTTLEKSKEELKMKSIKTNSVICLRRRILLPFGLTKKFGGILK